MENTMKQLFAGLMATAMFIKDLHRSRRDQWVFGVCGGIADNCAIPSWIFRLGFIVSVLSFGIGLFVYLGMALLLPMKSVPKKTKTQKAIEHLERSGFVVMPKGVSGVSSAAGDTGGVHDH